MFVLDTDHATFYQQGNVVLEKHLSSLSPGELATTIVTYEEQVTGRLWSSGVQGHFLSVSRRFFRLGRTLDFFCRVPGLSFDPRAANTYQRLTASQVAHWHARSADCVHRSCQPGNASDTKSAQTIVRCQGLSFRIGRAPPV